MSWWSDHAPRTSNIPSSGSPATNATSAPVLTPDNPDPWSPTNPGGTPSGAPAATGSNGAPRSIGANATMDDATIGQWVAYWATLPNADPTLKSDPAYWIGKIKQTGGLSDANTTYWQGLGINNWRGLGPDANNPPSNFGQPNSPYASDPNAPAPYAPPKFVAPTGITEENDSGYQARLAAADQGFQHSAAANGSILSGGFQKALANYNQQYASSEFSNIYNRALSTYEGVDAPNSQFQYNAATNAYQNNNARTLSDYLSNYGIAHNTATDWWNNTNRLADRGLTAASNSGN